jgi:hypothetical protein
MASELSPGVAPNPALPTQRIRHREPNATLLHLSGVQEGMGECEGLLGCPIG